MNEAGDLGVRQTDTRQKEKREKCGLNAKVSVFITIYRTRREANIIYKLVKEKQPR